MNPETIQNDLAVQLVKTAGRTSYDWIKSRITQAKEISDEHEKDIIYNEIINKLMNDKAELEQIAREYKNLYEKVTISDEDIEYLHNTIRTLMIIINENFVEKVEDKFTDDMLDAFLNLLSKDTLKTMQLLGFNYKEAFGIPLTEICASFIKNKFSNNI